MSVVLDIVPKIRLGNAPNNAVSKMPKSIPPKANISAVPASVKATG